MEDDEIALQIMDRDQDGLSALLDRHGGRVRGYLRKKLGDRVSYLEIDYAVNCGLEKVWNNIEKFDDRKGELGPWFLQICYNAARDHLRREKHIRENETPLMDGQVAVILDEAEVSEVSPKLVKGLRAAIEKLPERQRQITNADLEIGGEAYNSSSLAAKLGIAASTVRGNRRKARASLQKELLPLLVRK